MAAITALGEAGRPALRRRPRHPRGDVTAAARRRRTSASTSSGCARNIRTDRGAGRRRRRGAAAAREDPQVARDRPAAARRRAPSGSPSPRSARPRCSPGTGATDIFIAYPLWLDDGPPSGCATWPARDRVAIGVDSVEGAARAGRLLGADGVEVLVEVDCGQHRTGCPPEEAGAVAVAAARAGLDVRGVFTFPGHSYAPDAMAAAAARRGRGALAAARAACRGRGPRGRRRQRRLDAEPGPPRHRRAHRAAAGRLRLRRRPAVGARHDAARVDRADLPGHRRQPRRRPAGARRRQQGARRRPGAVRHRLRAGCSTTRTPGSSCSPSTTPSSTSPAHRCRRSAASVDVVPNHCCAAVNLADDLWVEEHGELRPWPVAARGQNG